MEAPEQSRHQWLGTQLETTRPIARNSLVDMHGDDEADGWCRWSIDYRRWRGVGLRRRCVHHRRRMVDVFTILVPVFTVLFVLVMPIVSVPLTLVILIVFGSCRRDGHGSHQEGSSQQHCEQSDVQTTLAVVACSL